MVYSSRQSVKAAPPNLGQGNVQLNNLTVIHPDASVTYKTSNGGGSPAEDCLFDYHVYTEAPSTFLTFDPVLKLFECSDVTGIFETTRSSGNTEYPLGITYSLSGSAHQGTDYARMNGFTIIPSFHSAYTDTIHVLRDDISESVESIVFELDSSTLYNLSSQPPSISLYDCEISADEELKSPERFSIFPNPCYEMVEISFTSDKPVFIQLIDQTGHIVLSHETMANNHRICMQHLRSGMYMVRIRIGGRFYTNKIIKI